MSSPEEIWVPLVDEPIGSLVSAVEAESPALRALVSSPRRLLAFRTFAYIRVGLLLGQLLFDNDFPPYDGSETWVETLLHDPRHRESIAREVRTVAEEVAADPKYGDEDQVGPDDATRERFRAFLKRPIA